MAAPVAALAALSPAEEATLAGLLTRLSVQSTLPAALSVPLADAASLLPTFVTLYCFRLSGIRVLDSTAEGSVEYCLVKVGKREATESGSAASCLGSLSTWPAVRW